MAQTVARKLTATLSPEEKKRIETKPTDSLEAYDFYLRAKELVSRGAIEAVLGTDENHCVDAIGLLEQAVRLDPKFTLAYCASAQIHGLLYFRDPSPERRAMGDAAIANALRLQPDLPEVRLAYAFQLYRYGYPDYERIREQLAIAKRGLTKSAEVIRLEAWMDRRQGKWEKAIQDLNEAITRDPRNIVSIQDLADTLSFRQFRASEKAYDRLIGSFPTNRSSRLRRHSCNLLRRPETTAASKSAIAALPASMADDTDASFRLDFALADRDWQQAKEIIEKLKGSEDNGEFAYGYGRFQSAVTPF